MSYTKMMKWNRKHPKGTKQPVLMHTNSGFWPSSAFLDSYFEYKEECERYGVIPAECEDYYHNSSSHDKVIREAKQNRLKIPIQLTFFNHEKQESTKA